MPANIAKGHARSTARESSRFLSIAKGSLMETETFVMLVIRLGSVADAQADAALAMITQVSKMLTRLRARLREPGLARRFPPA